MAMRERRDSSMRVSMVHWMALAFDIQIEAAVGVGLEAVTQMIVRRAQESRARCAVLDDRVEDVVRADFQVRGIQRLASVVVEYHDEAAELVVLERLHDVGSILDCD